MAPADAITVELLRALDARAAAACLVARRSEGLSGNEQRILEQWLAADPSHHAAFVSAEQAWQVFDAADGCELLSAMRAHAVSDARARSGSGIKT